jgi:uncharacterized lipoprotein YddW (UPF0748 family)
MKLSRNQFKHLFILIFFLASAASAFSQTNKPKIMWFDAEANFQRFSNPDSIDYYLEKVHDLGFTDVAVDVRPITGEVLFDTKFAPRMREWKGFKRADFDYLGRFIQTSHRLGMKVHATMNVFVAGHNYFDRGLIYSSHPEWASMMYTPDGMKPITAEKEKYGAMVNPINADFQKHILNVMRDLVRQYPSLDGILLDRVRYDGIEADFSSMSRVAFEKYIGAKVKHFPQDIFTWKKDAAGKPHVNRGQLFNKWIEWRTKNIYDFMAKARKNVKTVNPKISFGTYTGAWYPSYYEVGVNFASNKYDPSRDYDWATKDYHKYGYMELLDTYITGNYYTDITAEEAAKNKNGVKNETDFEALRSSWYNVEGSCNKLRTILGGHPFIGGLLVDQLYATPQKLSEAVKMNLEKSDGLMVFDICHLIAKPELWNASNWPIK